MKRKLGVRIDEELLLELRAAAVVLRGVAAYGRRGASLTEIVEVGVRGEIARLRRKHNAGKPFRGKRGARIPAGATPYLVEVGKRHRRFEGTAAG